MGFFRFLKKDRSTEVPPGSDLDVPPEPPKGMAAKQKPVTPSDSFAEEVPNKTTAVKSRVPLETQQRDIFAQEPEQPLQSVEEEFSMDSLVSKDSKLESVGTIEDEPPEPVVDVEHDIVPKQEQFEQEAVKEQKQALTHHHQEQPIFIRVDRFKTVIKDVSAMRNGLRRSTDTMVKLQSIDENRENHFEKWKGLMQDLQKKTIFVDKTLFKGDGK